MGIIDVNVVKAPSELIVRPALEHAFAADTEAAEELHKVGITVGNTQPPEDTHAPVHAFFRLVEILVKVIVNVPGALLRPNHAVLDDVLVQPLINRSKLLVGKRRAEKLVSGKAEKVRSYPAFAGNYDGVAV